MCPIFVFGAVERSFLSSNSGFFYTLPASFVTCARAFSLGRLATHKVYLLSASSKKKEQAHHSKAAPRETIAPRKDGFVKLKEESAPGMR